MSGIYFKKYRAKVGNCVWVSVTQDGQRINHYYSWVTGTLEFCIPLFTFVCLEISIRKMTFLLFVFKFHLPNLNVTLPTFIGTVTIAGNKSTSATLMGALGTG